MKFSIDRRKGGVCRDTEALGSGKRWDEVDCRGYQLDVSIR
jgi:hypothetical protein